MIHPRPNQIWFNESTGYNELIKAIDADGRIVTDSFDSDPEIFLQRYTFNYQATIQSLRSRIDKLTDQLNRTIELNKENKGELE